MGGGGQSGSVAVASAVLLLLILGVHGRQVRNNNDTIISLMNLRDGGRARAIGVGYAGGDLGKRH